MQPLLHLPLHFGKPRLHHLHGPGLGARLSVRHGAQAPRKLVLPLAEQLHRLAEPGHLPGKLLGGLRRAPGPHQRHHQEDHDQQNDPRRGKGCKHQRIFQ